ncbi:zinc finger CCHC domain-containing 3-like [Paramuricea clavata]|uniref:Zinc finger CCHC domain-containing 3-like n=1 Tax=Paramuricea clavata TaxID=317549 RepID=A0A7D9JH50_PARCT|nr:zinc finger CCHC domain-containing 3-like [Paramuricea clavata]
MDERRIGAEERGMDIEEGEENGSVGDKVRKVGDEVRKVGDEEGVPGSEERNPGGEGSSPGGEMQNPGGDDNAAEGGEQSQEIVIERAGEEMQTAGKSWADIVGSQNLSQGVVPLPHARFGARVMDAVLKCVRQDTIKCMQQVPGPRYRLTFRSLEYKQLFLDQPFYLRGERVIAQELDMATLQVKVLYAPSEISNQAIAATLAKYGKIVKVDREMYRDWPNVETGVRLATMSELTEGIPRRLFIGPYPIETRYRGQVPLCGRCGEYGHRVATCSNDVKCFKCGQNGHIQRQCFKCFLCGQFGHVRANCLENRRDVSNDSDDETSESNLSNDIGRDEDRSVDSRSNDEDMDPVDSTSCKDPGDIRDEVMNKIYNDVSQSYSAEQGSVQTVENNKRKAEEDVSIPDEGVKVPGDSTDQRVSDMGSSPEERTKKTNKEKKKKRKKHNKP